MQNSIAVVILAAGQGKRMKSALPKVLHAIAGKPMLEHVVDTAQQLQPVATVVVFGHGGDVVRDALQNNAKYQGKLGWARQDPPQGTGHAVLQAIPHIKHTETTLVLYGDVPLISADTLRPLLEDAARGQLAWLTQTVENPTGLGRIVRDSDGKVQEIVEEKDANDATRTIREINTGFLACPTAWLEKWLPTLGNKNAQGEYYLTDILKLAVGEGRAVSTHQAKSEVEITGVNSRAQLAELERAYQRIEADKLMAAGVTLRDPARIDIRGTLNCKEDVTIDVNCVFEGNVTLAEGVVIGANCVLKDCEVGTGTEILPFSHIEGAHVGARARIGPYARLRPQTTLADEVHIGNFVEVKASEIGLGSKANHLSYIGDTTVGQQVNIGAGTITCNYDGANKHRTVIEDNVHIGSDVQLVAPVTVAAGATVGAGSTVWKDVAANTLVVNPKSQAARSDWIRPKKQK
jgi:bifunctional UDP-N-acetylglucosamine pyrophosphorylase / glucosamine-1-phosphate N-acetyltransferase